MNSLERVRKVINHERPDRVPVSLHNFLTVGKFIDHFNLGELLQDGQLMAKAHLECWKQISHDIIQLENGTIAMAQALGANVKYFKDAPPRVLEPLLKDLKDVDSLQLPDMENTFPLNENLKTTQSVCQALGSEVFVCGRADQGPMALASTLRGVENLMYDIADSSADSQQKKQLELLLDFCTRCCTNYALAQGEAGAHGTCIGGYGLSTISPQIYREFEQKYEKQYVERVKNAGIVPFLHFCGREDAILSDIIETGADVLELASNTCMHEAKKLANGKVTLLGFVEVDMMARGTAEEIQRRCSSVINVLKDYGNFILSPDCALLTMTPIENMKALVESAKRFGKYT